MSANPVLTTWNGHTIPQLYQREVIAVERGEIEAEIDSIPNLHNKWLAKGRLFLTSLRLVFVAYASDDRTGLIAYELPLAFISASKFNQPIFFCNNLAGTAWSTSLDGLPEKALPPVHFRFSFRNGGVGTFLPLYFHLQELAAQHSLQSEATSTGIQGRQGDIKDHVATAFVDPSDPSTLYLAQPETTGRASMPVYASNYGEDEEYQPL